MTEITKSELEKILVEIDSQFFEDALASIEDLYVKRKRGIYLDVLHCYVLSELCHSKEAKIEIPNLTNAFKSKAGSNFGKLVYKNINMINEYLNLSLFLEDKICIYEAYLLKYDFNKAVEIGKLLKSNFPGYLLFAIACVNIKNNKKGTMNQNIDDYVKKIGYMDEKLLYFLLKHGLLNKKDIFQYFSKVKKKENILHYILLKEMFLLDVLPIDFMQKFSKAKINGHKNIKTSFLNSLLDFIDDWSLYEYAIENKIDLYEKKGINYQYYALKMYKDVAQAIKILNKTNSYYKIEQIIEIVGESDLIEAINNPKNINLKYLINYLSSDFEKIPDLNTFYNYYLDNQNENNLKLLISLLISSKKEKNLLIALFLVSQPIYSNTYEFKFIRLFLLRHFLLVDDLIEQYKDLKIQNVLVEKYSYIWSDIYVLFSNNSEICKKFSVLLEETLKENVQNLKTMNRSLLGLIDKGLFFHAYDLLETKKSVEKNVLTKEIQEHKLYEKKSFFLTNDEKNILGKKCSWLFEKLTMDECKIKNTEFEKIKFLNIYNCIESRNVTDVFDIDVSEFFIKDVNLFPFLKNLYEYQKLLN